MEPHSTTLSGAATGREGFLGGKQVPLLASEVVPPRRPGQGGAGNRLARQNRPERLMPKVAGCPTNREIALP
jgi:hypothetical protein